MTKRVSYSLELFGDSRGLPLVLERVKRRIQQLHRFKDAIRKQIKERGKISLFRRGARATYADICWIAALYVASAGHSNFNPAFLRFSTSPLASHASTWRPGKDRSPGRGGTNELGKNGRQAVHRRQQITAGASTLPKTSRRAQP